MTSTQHESGYKGEGASVGKSLYSLSSSLVILLSEFDLLFLPPYSPNLNLIERLWKLTKRRCLTNRYYPDFGAFCGAIDKCLEDLSEPLKKELTSLMTLNLQFFKNHNS